MRYMDDNQEGNVAERLMGVLISKMESMDNDLQSLKTQNAKLRKMVSNPVSMLKKAGFVHARTNAPSDVMADEFRGDGSELLKGVEGNEISIPSNNAAFHEMDWGDIHALASQAKSQGSIGNQLGME